MEVLGDEPIRADTDRELRVEPSRGHQMVQRPFVRDHVPVPAINRPVDCDSAVKLIVGKADLVWKAQGGAFHEPGGGGQGRSREDGFGSRKGGARTDVFARSGGGRAEYTRARVPCSGWTDTASRPCFAKPALGVKRCDEGNRERAGRDTTREPRGTSWVGAAAVFDTENRLVFKETHSDLVKTKKFTTLPISNHPTIFKHLVSVCTALHFRQQNLIPHRAQLYRLANPHTLQNFRGALVVLGAAAAVR